MRHRLAWWAACVAVGSILAAPLSAGLAAESPPAVSTMSSADWRADIEFARAEMPRRHANLFHTLTPEQFNTALDRLSADVDRLGEHEVVVRLAEIVASVGDGHTRLTLPMDPGAGFFSGHTATAAPRIATFRHLPLRLARTGEGYVVVATDGPRAGLLGAQLVEIDGRPMAEVERVIVPVVNRDNEHQLFDLLPRFVVVPEVLHARGISPSTEQTTWRFVSANGKPQAEVLRPVARGVQLRWQSLPSAGWPRPVPEGAAPQLWFADIDQPSAVYVRIEEITDRPETSFAAFAGALESHLAATSRRRLILDLRGNPGGDNSLNPPLVRGLIRTPWVSEPGALFVLIDGGTFSAAMNLAEDLERWLPAVFVGTGTGAKPNTYGDARKLELPRSGLTVRLSSLYWQNHPKDARAAIEPLVAAAPTIGDLRTPRDPAARVLASPDTTPPTLAGTWRGRLSAEFRHLAVELQIKGTGGGTGSLSIRELGVDAAEVRFDEFADGVLRGTAQLRGGTLDIGARAGGNRLVGWMLYRGTRYPMVLEPSVAD